MGKVEISIKIDIKETELEPLSLGEVERIDDGYFRIILDEKEKLDINALEYGMLRTNYPALRDALSQYLENVSKKKRF